MSWATDFSPGVLRCAECNSTRPIAAAGTSQLAIQGPREDQTDRAGDFGDADELYTHACRHQRPDVAITLVLLAIALFVAIERIGPQSF